MKKNKTPFIMFGVIAVSALVFILCSSSNEAGEPRVDERTSNQAAGKNFKSHVKSANKFWELIESGRDFRNQKKYEQALANFKEAHNTYAFGNIEKPIALVHAAETYEMMQQYKEAAILFEKASDIAMHKTNKAKYRSRAEELRQKAETETGETGRPPQ